MKISRKLYAAFLILLSAFFYACGDDTQLNEQSVSVSSSGTVSENNRFVTSKSGLRIRKKPGLNTLKLGLIRYGERVYLLEEKSEIITIDGIEGKWSKVNYKNITGWVFGGFLSTKVPE